MTPQELAFTEKLNQARNKDVIFGDIIKNSVGTIDPDNIEEPGIKVEDQPKPISRLNFSFFLTLAILADAILDILALFIGLSGVGLIVYVLAWIIKYFIIFILFIWAYIHGSSRTYFKILIWALGVLTLESIPVLKDLATSSIAFVIWVYLNQRKEIRRTEEIIVALAKLQI